MNELNESGKDDDATTCRYRSSHGYKRYLRVNTSGETTMEKSSEIGGRHDETDNLASEREHFEFEEQKERKGCMSDSWEN